MNYAETRRRLALDQIVEAMRLALPPIFAGTAVGELTGGAVNWGTIQNKRCNHEIPDDCFVRSGTRVLVVRDPFLRWWATTLTRIRRMARGFWVLWQRFSGRIQRLTNGQPGQRWRTRWVKRIEAL